MSNFFFGIALIILSILPAIGPVPEMKDRIISKVKPTRNEPSNQTNTSDLKISKIPAKALSYQEISSGSRAALFVDYNSGEILFAKNEKQKLPMASITKLMTALIVEESLDSQKVIAVPEYNLRPLDSVMGIPIGTKIKTGELLHGLLIESGADAAQAFAKEIAGSEQKFAAIMNERAQFYGLSNTQFTNSVGYDENGHYSTAEDIVKLSRIALSNKEISEIIKKENYVATAETGQKFYLANTNKLLNGTTYQGLKTGTTFAAGECLASLYVDDQRKIIGVVLASPNRFGETRDIIEWTKRNFLWQ